MVSAIKTRDKMQCVNKRHNETSSLTIGKIYTIKRISSCGTYLDFEEIGGHWSVDQFEPYNEWDE